MARWIVDGLNVIGARPDGWWRDRSGAMRALVAALEAFAEAAPADEVEALTVVFDGRPRDTGARRVAVRFAPVADDEIAALAGPGVRVVTSDAALAARVRAAGAEVTGAGAFRRRVEDAAGRPRT
jgi:predicted RNA-binding protein with PIN domain